MAEIRWTEEAVWWLKDIHEYISEDNPAAAQKVVEGIYEKSQILKTFPEIGYKYKDEPDGEIRILLYGHYRIAYIIKDTVVEILGIFHGALKIERYIKR
ncbi:type II toxin-antitoxin system RelE/ParE family toxin [bacterium]|jgi:plasmid stabilization system protein ParE|nr:type II toxin-antitoxin system RelE/ParE family toxin [bacterium]